MKKKTAIRDERLLNYKSTTFSSLRHFGLLELAPYGLTVVAGHHRASPSASLDKKSILSC
jgi:hypothetical protein